MPGRVGVSSIVYAKAFISKTWAERASMKDHERPGFYQFLYITACGYAESILCDYLKALLFSPIVATNATREFPMRKVTDNGISTLVSTEPEQDMVKRILTNTSEELDKAPFEKIASIHRIMIGKSIADTVGADIFRILKGLVSIRNVIAHGREVYVSLDDSLIVDTSFERHTLENAIRSLEQAGLIAARQGLPDANDLNSIIYREDIVLHFWEASVQVGKFYRNLAGQQKVFPMWWAPALESLAP